jgi:hypothetical protein
MLTVTGTYQNGKFDLEKMPRISKKTKVTVIFEDEEDKPIEKKKRIFGFAKGSVGYMSEDFNEPLDDLKEYI